MPAEICNQVLNVRHVYDRESGSLTHKASSNPLEILLAPPGTHKEDYGEGQRWGESLSPQPDPNITMIYLLSY